MEKLILENINRKAPYSVMQMEEFPHLFYFHTDYGVDYEISSPEIAFLSDGLTGINNMGSITFRRQKERWMEK